MKSVSENIYVLNVCLDGDELKIMNNISNVYCQEDSSVLVIGNATFGEIKEILEHFKDGEYPVYSLYNDGIEGYVNTQYDGCEYDILGSSGSYTEFSELTKEVFEYAILNKEVDLNDWENYVDKIIKECIIGCVNEDIRSQIVSLKEDGFNIDMLEVKLR